MTLRTRLFLFFGALIAVLASAELWLVRSLARDLDVQSDNLALSVGTRFVQALLPNEELNPTGSLPQGVFLLHTKRVRDTAVDGPESPDPKRLDGSVSSRLLSVVVRADEPSAGQDPQKKLVLESSSAGSGQSDLHKLAGEYGHGKWSAAPRFKSQVALRWSGDFPGVTDGEQDLFSIPLERAGFQGAMDRFQFRLLLGSAGILGLGLLIAGLVAHRVSSPLRELSRAAGAVGQGDFGVQVAAGGDPEVRKTLQAFNAMSSRLTELDAEANRLREGQHLSELGEVARGLAHSLRNPLHVLGLTVEGMADGSDPALARTARAHMERIDRTLRTLLALSSSGGEQAARVDLASVVRDVALELLQDPTCAVPTSILADDSVSIQGVAAELRAVVHVLMVNAAEASPPDTAIAVLVETHPDGVQLRVQDLGQGLASGLRERLFTPHTSTKPGGAGMGLYLAQRIAKNRYGGSLALNDRPNGGLEAHLILGARRADA